MFFLTRVAAGCPIHGEGPALQGAPGLRFAVLKGYLAESSFFSSTGIGD